MDGSACGACRSLLPSGRPDTLRSQNCHQHPCSVLARTTGRTVYSWPEEKGRLSWRVSFCTRTYWAFVYKCQPRPGIHNTTGDGDRDSPSLLVSGPHKAQGSASL